MTKQNSFMLFQKFLKPMRRIGKLIGLDVFDSQFKFGIRSFFLTCIASFVVISYMFMIFTNYPLNTLLEGLTISTLTIQALHKLYLNVGSHTKVRSCFDTIYSIHEMHQNEDKYQTKLNLCVSYCITLFKVLMVSYSGVMCCYSILPIFVYYYYGVKTTIIPIHFPFINVKLTTGFVVNIFHQVLFMVCGCFGVLYVDMIFFMFILHSTVFVALISAQFEDLNKLLLDGESQLNVVLKNKMADCLMVHQQYINYITKIQDTYSTDCLVQVVTSEGLLTLSLFLIVWTRWIIGPFMAIAVSCQLLGYCLLGTVIQYQNEIILKTFYNCYWYLLPVNLQKQIIFILMNAQQSPELQVGKFAKLNVETFMQVFKATYSYLMLILEFVANKD